MNQLENTPPFVQLYETNGAKLWMNNGNPVRCSVVYNYLKSNAAIDTASTEADTFLMLEGYLFRHEVNSESYPTLAYYLDNRGNADTASLWEAFNQLVELGELKIIREAYFATRRHATETMAELSIEEKKSE